MTKKVWITKYALSSGIFQVDAEMVPGSDRSTKDYASNSKYYIFTKDWEATEDEAQAVADRMRLAKIASLKKQIAKLEKMTVKYRDAAWDAALRKAISRALEWLGDYADGWEES